MFNSKDINTLKFIDFGRARVFNGSWNNTEIENMFKESRNTRWPNTLIKSLPLYYDNKDIDDKIWCISTHQSNIANYYFDDKIDINEYKLLYFEDIGTIESPTQKTISLFINWIHDRLFFAYINISSDNISENNLISEINTFKEMLKKLKLNNITIDTCKKIIELNKNRSTINVIENINFGKFIIKNPEGIMFDIKERSKRFLEYYDEIKQLIGNINHNEELIDNTKDNIDYDKFIKLIEQNRQRKLEYESLIKKREQTQNDTDIYNKIQSVQ